MHYINHNLKFYRQYSRLKQDEIAAALKTTLGVVKAYDRGSATPPIEMVIKIADMMQISLDTLVKVKLNSKNYLKKKGEKAPDLESRVAALEAKLAAAGSVNKIVNKKQKK